MNFTNPTTANEFLQVGVNFMNSKPPQFLAASCVFRYLYQIVSQTDRSTISGYLVRCGIELHNKSLINSDILLFFLITIFNNILYF